MRRAFGVAGAGHGKTTGLNFRYAWPSADWGSLPLEGGIEAAYKRDLAASPDPDKLRAIGRMAGSTYVRTTDRFDLERPP